MALPPMLCAQGAPVDVPSGLSVRLHDVRQDALGDGYTYRFRFVAPEIADEAVDFFALVDDMEFLCNDFALAHIPQLGPRPARIVIVLMSEAVDFGAANPDVTQFFESYSLSDGLCIWEAF